MSRLQCSWHFMPTSLDHRHQPVRKADQHPCLGRQQYEDRRRQRERREAEREARSEYGQFLSPRMSEPEVLNTSLQGNTPQEDMMTIRTRISPNLWYFNAMEVVDFRVSIFPNSR
ncbi:MULTISPECIES: hypothetical protein [unclassified Mesorhizobium]|uniref:hypothetical protein n=1 Tax=unclassified Mesorhizobium TaxID=325217 RepID=UPI0019D45D67|nr:MULTISPECIES: hypothetical protein [unclassified Mesorhizobium]